MEALSLKSTKREAVGKGNARLLRRQGGIPAILYGKDVDPINLSIDVTEFNGLLRSTKTSQFLLDLHIDGVIKKVTIKELQRRPVSSDILHVDFYEVAMDRKIKVNVQISTFGTCKGVELGGMLQIIRREVEVLCLPDNIPSSIDIDITELDVGDSFHATDLPLADGLEIPGEVNFTILTVLSQKSAVEEGVVENEEMLEIAEGDEAGS